MTSRDSINNKVEKVVGVYFIWARNKIDGSEKGVLPRSRRLSTRFDVSGSGVVSLDENREAQTDRSPSGVNSLLSPLLHRRDKMG